MKVRNISIFNKSKNCWKTPVAERATILVDGANYYGALRSSMLKARKSIIIVGWDVDSRVPLRGNAAPNDGAPEHLRDFLCYLVDRTPDLRIYILLWDFSVLYALEREPVPALSLTWVTPPQIEICLDDIVPLGAAHHQKMVIVDSKVGYCGGIDLALQRWDTRLHEDENPFRIDPSGKFYRPFHDVQLLLDGDAATVLTNMAVLRWKAAFGQDLFVAGVDSDPWPDGVAVDFKNQTVAISRTVPQMGNAVAVHEIEQMYLDMIAVAVDCIYFENQFFTADVIAKALVNRMKVVPELEVILVSSNDPYGFLETHSMATGRHRFMSYFERDNLLDRIRLVYPHVGHGTDVLVHAKLVIIDNTILRIGSANVNNRSMSTDSECDITLCAPDISGRNRINYIRNDLVAEHLGLSADDVSAELEKSGSLRALIDQRQDEPRTLRKTDYIVSVNGKIAEFVEGVVDPERPSDVSRFVGDILSSRPAGLPIRGRILTFIVAMTIVTLVGGAFIFL